MEYAHETSWDGFERHDGVRVAVAHGGIWLVLPPDDRPPIMLCPCCQRVLRSADEAKLTANAVYPPG